jgi:hypothetical protein
VRLFLSILIVLVISAAVGLGATYYALSRDTEFGSLTVGSWTAWPRTGTINADPYARALIAKTGRLPVAVGDGISFTATADDNGKLLDGRCDVVITGVTPAARFWTLTLYNSTGELVANSINRHGFTSHEIIRQANGEFSIVIGPRANPGNWLPSGGIERYTVALRLYDTPVGVATRAGREVPMPAVTTRSCP